jgi:hypothetical protein
VEDMFLHGPASAKCTSALKKILHFMVHVGLICHPTKLKPPVQVQKFCAFLNDSETTPKLRIPDNKVLQVFSLLGFLVRGSITLMRRLALEVVVGPLQSLVPATPNAIRASFLHHVYQNIHNETLENFDNIQDFYHSGLDLGALTKADFHWWEKNFKEWVERTASDQGLLHFRGHLGDGRGSGRGGTFEWVDSETGALPQMESWMGAWNGTLHSFTSNWR